MLGSLENLFLGGLGTDGNREQEEAGSCQLCVIVWLWWETFTYRNDIPFLLLFFLCLCPGMSSKEIYGNWKLQNVLFIFCITLHSFKDHCDSEFTVTSLWCLWNLWVMVEYISADTLYALSERCNLRCLNTILCYPHASSYVLTDPPDHRTVNACSWFVIELLHFNRGASQLFLH